jgi:hypothetical protein
MGFALRWGGTRKVVAMLIENGIRVLIPVSAAVTYNAFRWIGNEISRWAFSTGDGVTVTPLSLTDQEVLQQEDDAANNLIEEATLEEEEDDE